MNAMEPHHARDQFVVVTGGSSGIGRALAEQLAATGASVLVGSRRTTEDRFEHRPIDLASKASVAEFANGLVREDRPIDLLILNAGVHVPWRKVTTIDGQELHWQVNYLSNFLLSHRLLDLCRRSALKRIVYVASEAHRLAALPGAPLLGFWYRYARSKEAAVTFFLRLQELHPELNVRVVSPGYVDTEIHRRKSRTLAWLERSWSLPRTPQTAARETMASFDPRAAASVYWDRGSPGTASRRSTDVARAQSLWQASIEPLRDLLPGAQAPQRITNYAGTFSALGPAISCPATVEELAALTRRAAETGRNIRVVGKRHSYNDSFYSRSCMVSLEHLTRVVAFDAERRTITCEGGISIGAVCKYLDERGFALRYCGNFGEQTLAGALATGTHGYGREGGVMSELVRAVTVLGPDGRLTRTSDEQDLGALRLSLGALGVVVEITLAIEPAGSCRYDVACMPREEFALRLDDLARANEYLRFVPHPFDERSVFYVTINREAGGAPPSPARWIGDGSGGAGRLLVPWLRMPPVRTLLGRVLAVSRHRYTLHVPFSTTLFIRSGVVRGHAGLARVGQLALDRPDWLNMELAIPRDRYSAFARLFAEERPRLSRFSPRQPYYTCRVVGAASNVLLAPNYARDVVFCDIHADPAEPWAHEFLRRMEAAAMKEMSARPHWGKLFFAERENLHALYPGANIDAFAAARRRFDPEGVFSNAYTRRVLGP